MPRDLRTERHLALVDSPKPEQASVRISHKPAGCHADACNQGRKACPCPAACGLAERWERESERLPTPGFRVFAVLLVIAVGATLLLIGASR